MLGQKANHVVPHVGVIVGHQNTRSVVALILLRSERRTGQRLVGVR